MYSFGVLLWEMLTGTRAYAGMTHAQIVVAVVAKRQALSFPETLAAPPVLLNLTLSCMAHNPEQRPCFDEIVAVLNIMQPTIESWIIDELPGLEAVAKAVAEAAAAAAAQACADFRPENVASC